MISPADRACAFTPAEWFCKTVLRGLFANGLIQRGKKTLNNPYFNRYIQDRQANVRCWNATSDCTTMGYLDELRKQATEKQQREAAQARYQQALRKDYLEKVHPLMVKIYSHLSEFIAHFQVVWPAINTDYALTASGTVARLTQQDHKIVTDSRDEMKEIIFRYTCLGDENIRYQVENRKNIDKHIEYLQRHNLKFDSRMYRNDNHEISHAIISVVPVVAVTVLINGEIETGKIRFRFHNVEALGTRTHTFSPEQITDDLIDNLIKYIARETDHFMQLDISEAARRKLQHKLKLEKMRREQELAEAEKRYQAEQTGNGKKP